MYTAKLFKNGRSQAVRLPKEFRISDSEIFITKIDNLLILIPKDNPWASLIKSLENFSDDFLESRNQPQEQSRDSQL